MTVTISRRRALALVTMAAGLAGSARALAGAQVRTRVDVYKDPSCGCCGKWVDHMNANGFDARVIAGDPTAAKTKYGIPAALHSCHTGVVGGYVVEGHVPAADVKRLLAAKPANVVGLTIPGMPASAPGMDLTPFQPYTVLSFDKQGRTTTFAKHERG